MIHSDDMNGCVGTRINKKVLHNYELCLYTNVKIRNTAWASMCKFVRADEIGYEVVDEVQSIIWKLIKPNDHA